MWCYLLHFAKVQSSWVTYSRPEPEFKPNILMISIFTTLPTISLVQFSHSVVSDSLWSHGLQHTSLPCSSPTCRVTQTHVHRVSDAIQPSHPLSSPSLPALNLSQHQGLFQWVSSSHQVAKVLEFQHQSFQQIFSFRMDWLDLLAVQGTLKSLIQHHCWKASIFGSHLSL